MRCCCRPIADTTPNPQPKASQTWGASIFTTFLGLTPSLLGSVGLPAFLPRRKHKTQGPRHSPRRFIGTWVNQVSCSSLKGKGKHEKSPQVQAHLANCDHPCESHEVCKPQPLPEPLLGHALFPHVSFRNASLQAWVVARRMVSPQMSRTSQGFLHVHLFFR